MEERSNRRPSVDMGLYKKGCKDEPFNFVILADVILYLYRYKEWKRMYTVLSEEDKIWPEDLQVMDIERHSLNLACCIAQDYTDSGLWKREFKKLISKCIEPMILTPHCPKCDNKIFAIKRNCLVRKYGGYGRPKDAYADIDFVEHWLWQCHPEDGQELRKELLHFVYLKNAGRLVLPEHCEKFENAVNDFLERCYKWETE